MSPIFAEDLCILKGDSTILAIVDRAWRDVDPGPLCPDEGEVLRHESVSRSQLKQLLSSGLPPQGHVLVSFVAPHQGRALVPEGALVLLDRSLCVGDVVKRSFSEAQSGTVVRLNASVSLQPLTAFELHSFEALYQGKTANDNALHDIPVTELCLTDEYCEGDHVIYKDWVGVVTGIVEDVTVRLNNGSVVVVENSDDLEVPLHISQKGYNSKTKLHRRVADQLNDKCHLAPDSLIESEPPDSFFPGQPVVSKKGNLRRGRWVFGTYDPSISSGPKVLATVLEVRPIEMVITWLAPNVTTSALPRPSNVLSSDEFGSGKLVRYPAGNENTDLASGDYVKFSDPAGAALKYDGSQRTNNSRNNGTFTRIPRTATQGYDLNTFLIRETNTCVLVQWQDGSFSEAKASSLVPYLNVDDHDVWPGELIVLKESESLLNPTATPENEELMSPGQVGVVQSTDAIARTAHVRWFEDPKIEILGKERDVLIPGSTLGVLSTIIEEVPLYEIAAYPAINRRRGDLVLLLPGDSYGSFQTTLHKGIGVSNDLPTSESQSSTSTDALGLASRLRRNFKYYMTRLAGARSTGPLAAPRSASSRTSGTSLSANDSTSPGDNFEWFGEVVDLGLDGMLTIRIQETSCSSVSSDSRSPIRITVCKTVVVIGGDDGDDDDEDDDEDNDISLEEYDLDASGVESDEDRSSRGKNDVAVGNSVQYEGGSRIDTDINDDSWMTDDETSSSSDVSMDDIDDTITETAQPLKMRKLDVEDVLAEKETVSNHLIPSATLFSSFPSMPTRFEILNTAVPRDHHFYDAIVPFSATLMRHITKEQRILQSSLPDGTFARTWDDRLDLLRVLIIGPRDTPYELAPFLIDFQFGRNFPSSPPDCFFHSWTNGLGRVNPNLYEDGKVCLSLLGTWPADQKNEGWSGSQSSMLQVIVSLMGLVLVKEPFYNEAGFEALVGTAESHVSSSHYTERAFVMSKAFVTRALRHSISGMEGIIHWLYLLDNGPQLLRTIIAECSGEMLDQRRLSKGATIMLKKHVAALEKFPPHVEETNL